MTDFVPYKIYCKMSLVEKAKREAAKKVANEAKERKSRFNSSNDNATGGGALFPVPNRRLKSMPLILRVQILLL